MGLVAKPGPMCELLDRPNWLDDGTKCLCKGALPGVTGSPSFFARDHFDKTIVKGSHLAQEGWFEEHYPNLLETTRRRFIEDINNWVQSNWGQSPYRVSERVPVHGTNKYKHEGTAGWTRRSMRDNLFEGCGDTPQSFNQADLVRVGSFAIDIETPVEIEYDKNGKDFRWRTMMYVEDGLGVNDDDLMAKIPSMKEWAPRRRVKRAKWDIAGSGSYSGPKPFPRHKVVPGDTLSGLARKYYGDAKLWPILYKFNQEAIGQDPALLKVGMVLEIPDLDQLSPGMKEQAIRELTPSTPGAKVIPAPPLR